MYTRGHQLTLPEKFNMRDTRDIRYITEIYIVCIFVCKTKNLNKVFT